MKATELDVLALLRDSGALKEGHFLLSSGLHSPAYVQCALLLQDAYLAHRVGDALAQRLARLEPESVLAPALGGLIIGHETAAELGVPMRFTEREDGKMTLRRGFELTPGERLVVVEDVVTTGRSTREVIDVAEEKGAKVIAVAAILQVTFIWNDYLVGLVFTVIPIAFQVFHAAYSLVEVVGGKKECQHIV